LQGKQDLLLHREVKGVKYKDSLLHRKVKEAEYKVRGAITGLQL